MRRLIPALALVLSLAACATPQSAYLQGSAAEIAAETENQKELALREQYRSELRLQRVAQPILTANASLCGENIGPYYGFSVWSKGDVPAAYRDTALRIYNLDDGLRVAAVVPGSPAAKAGLVTGDRLVELNGKEVNARFMPKRGVRETMKKSDTLDMVIQRRGKEQRLRLRSVTACNFDVAMSANEAINAYADGEQIVVDKGMMRFVRNDNELALVVGHELAHNAASHISMQQQNAIGAGILGLVLDVAAGAAGANTNGEFTKAMMQAGGSAYSVNFEQEADYIGLYMMTRAGYATDGAANFWRRMAAENDPRSITLRSSHPTSPERFVAIEKIRREIAQKRAAGKSLVPNMTAPAAKSSGKPAIRSQSSFN